MKLSHRNDKLALTHDDASSSLATWWKAFSFTPPWMLPMLPVAGGLLHLVKLDQYGFGLIIIFSLAYFWLDLYRKKVFIDRQSLSHGLKKLNVAEISKIDTGRDWMNLPKYLRIVSTTGKEIKLHMRRMSGDDLLTLVNTVQRMSPSCLVDPDIDARIKYKRSKKLASFYDTAATVYVRYHVDRDWEDLPGTFVRLLKSWSRLIGPVGVMALLMPFSIFLNALCYGTVSNNWGSYSAHTELYGALVQIVTAWGTMQGNIASAGFSFLALAFQNPLSLLLTVSIVAITAASYFRAVFGANRITMDETEISLDSWQHLMSFNLASMRWSSISKIALSNIAKHQQLTLTSNRGKTIDLDVKAIDEKDRARFLAALKRFAVNCAIAPAIEELLDPPTSKSYTQLWLQSITMAPKDTVLKPIGIGTLLEGGRYEVIRKLGAGGQGAAYLCHDLTDKTLKPAPTVALKEMLIPPYLNSSVKMKLIEQFVSEATMLQNLHSPNIVGLIDYFVEERGAYLVLEHIEGSTLRDIVGETGALTGAQLNQLLPQMLKILKTLHSTGIVHRDFTPDNLILRPDGMLKLIDFNVAQDESEGTTATIVGKHAYVPPEQFRGKPTTQSDLYALGATLLYLITGEDPEPITQSSLPEHLRADNLEIDSVIFNCTAIELEERTKTVDELLENLSLNEDGASASTTAAEGVVLTIQPSDTQHDSDTGEVITLEPAPEKQYAG